MFPACTVSVGGTAGLFLGCSVLSIMEIFYFFTLKAFFYVLEHCSAEMEQAEAEDGEEEGGARPVSGRSDEQLVLGVLAGQHQQQAPQAVGPGPGGFATAYLH